MYIIGNLYNDGVYDEEGNEVTPFTQLPGWHVNTTHPVEAWEQYRVEPNTPKCVYWGHPTFFYVFESEEAFNALLNHSE